MKYFGDDDFRENSRLYVDVERLKSRLEKQIHREIALVNRALNDRIVVHSIVPRYPAAAPGSTTAEKATGRGQT